MRNELARDVPRKQRLVPGCNPSAISHSGPAAYTPLSCLALSPDFRKSPKHQTLRPQNWPMQVGRWSDAYGRKLFLVVCFSFAALPVLILTLHMQYGLSLYFYFPASVRPCPRVLAVLPDACICRVVCHAGSGMCTKTRAARRKELPVPLLDLGVH